ncbi:MAG TPA: prolipoprotein diacylglyceryl transferase family protein [Caulobacteraceae bacterium]|nr:prolipoprotein diacylglyceryl transferase family protein [Caulobacteraceae bacterium]
MILVPTAPAAHLAFDLAAWAAGLGLGLVLYRWRLREATQRLAVSTGPGYVAALAVGAVAGAWAAGSLNTLQGPSPALSHSIVGALVGAIAAVEAYKLARRVKGSTGAVFVGPFALGAVIGRWGCLFAGLPDRTYGTPTSLPWAVDLGDRVGRHPVQVYESLAMAAFLAVFLIGLKRRSDWTIRRGFYVMCVWYAAQRFAWEFFKPYPPVLGPLNLFHLLCLALGTYGLVFLALDRRRERLARP